ncbi:putative peroxisomal membrane protein 2, pxmp2 [Hibiscus syriacus]|uniref:Peroxisomal membrane protein 2, pxmp2 n=2 Tax=Hibiscus syriacus TaxID=106335 RepID=A0A6A2X093_HIBSY|nr:putative peroxisomal membrane protein 2, pxmp2 [Hibiscus syriacus]
MKMSHHQRSISTPGVSRKRKEREPFYSFKPSTPVQSSVHTSPKHPSSPNCSNQLLAGYMAHEFLIKGTLLGQQFDPARSESVPVAIASMCGPRKPVQQETEPKDFNKESQSYADVARILKEDGTHITGILNPTQLARWIKM